MKELARNSVERKEKLEKEVYSKFRALLVAKNQKTKELLKEIEGIKGM